MITDTDTVTLGPGVVVKEQSIGVAKTSKDIHNVDGIIGQGAALDNQIEY